MADWPGRVRFLWVFPAICLAAFLLFYPAFPELENHSLVPWVWQVGNSFGPFRHILLVPLVFPWLLFVAWRRHCDEVIRPSYFGLVPLLIGMILCWSAMRIGQPRIALFALPFLVIGGIHYGFGGRIARGAILPAIFLWFMIPLPGLEAILGNAWRVEVMESSITFGKLLGMDLEVFEGGARRNDINAMSFRGSSLGERFLIASVMAGFAFSFFSMRDVSKQVALFLFVFPVIFAVGVVRTLLFFGLVSAGYPEIGSWIHWDFGGLLQFVLLFLALWLVRKLMVRWWLFPSERR